MQSFSRSLEEGLHRAVALANERSQEYATLEHLLLALIDDWAAEGRTIILVLHDLSAVLQHCTSALLLGGGRALFGKPAEALTPGNLIRHGYLSESQAAWIEAMYTKPDERHV